MSQIKLYQVNDGSNICIVLATTAEEALTHKPSVDSFARYAKHDDSLESLQAVELKPDWILCGMRSETVESIIAACVSLKWDTPAVYSYTQPKLLIRSSEY